MPALLYICQCQVVNKQNGMGQDQWSKDDKNKDDG